MNKRCLWLLLAALLALLLHPLRADPVLNLPTGDMACTVTATFHGPVTKETSPSDPVKPATSLTQVIKSVEITRVGKLQRDEITYSDGTHAEAWIMTDSDLMLVQRTSGSSSFICEMPAGSDARSSFGCPSVITLNAAALHWINPHSFTGNATHEGKAALHYQASMPLTNFVPPKQILYHAWVDAKTLVPLAIDDGESLYELTFSKDPPTEQLALPVTFRKDLQEYQDANAAPRPL